VTEVQHAERPPDSDGIPAETLNNLKLIGLAARVKQNPHGGFGPNAPFDLTTTRELGQAGTGA
jgi:hypothetical protein